MDLPSTQMSTFPKFLRLNQQKNPGAPAIREKKLGIWHTVSWDQLADEVRVIAAALLLEGVQRGDHIGLLGENRPRLFSAMAAIQWIGGVVVPLFTDTNAQEITGPIQKANIAFIFAENQEQVDKLLGLMPQCPSLRRVFYDDELGMRHYRQSPLLSYAALMEQGRTHLAKVGVQLEGELERGSGKDPAALFFTSGTTGPALGVIHTHEALIERVQSAITSEGLSSNDTSLAYLPPAWLAQHVFAYAIPMVSGSCVCCPESSETMLNDMREMGPTIFLAPPRVLEALLTQVSIRINNTGGIKRGIYDVCMAVAKRVGAGVLSGEPMSAADRLTYRLSDAIICGPLRDVLGLSRVRKAYCAGDSIGADLLLFYRSLGIDLKQVYGSAEMGLFATLQAKDPGLSDSLGRPASGLELHLSPEGEVLFRSPERFLGYYKDAESTNLRTDAEGWLRTGDVGWLSPQGELHLIGRKQDIGSLKNGGLFAPKLIENKLKFSIYINEAIVLGKNRDAVCALIDIDTEAVGNWADKQGLSYTGFSDLVALDEVYRLVGEVISEVNAQLAKDPTLTHAQIHRFALLPKRLEPDDGEVTRMRKVRREVIDQRYASLVQALYDGSTVGHVDAPVRYEDGSAGQVSATVMIGSAQFFAASPLQKAA
ncbi:MAG: long-chain fatty acid--CoA ligase [Betaproteobacteria bacterium]|nr:long-chain fatty acid--CoA ligase [Betaproteobacteria bacterium]